MQRRQLKSVLGAIPFVVEWNSNEYASQTCRDSYKVLRRKWWAVLKGSTPWRSTEKYAEIPLTNIKHVTGRVWDGKASA